MKTNSKKFGDWLCCLLLIVFIFNASKLNMVGFILAMIVMIMSIAIKKGILDFKDNKKLYIIFNVIVSIIVIFSYACIFIIK
ncbi:hypothetical protein [Apilactobacillus micheneri]|uniref:Uncharacterized protein n=1 Tax=Apilactobacillus micheneri TaxID=1899430 RepID=A0A9Q8MUA2_9LACO|nr:hypothetical protein [Apilactobacillus micheneri]TPR40013.1 hypothetical protein DY121_04030 [Apilactobacillus micheneri]TPR41824.1 hypothetical protein DY123_04650 [Apilactobacillus micheneri]TPR44215.1 hypothetical protein DY130_04025 [Apilactobacillus micheneri]TPR45839.1 hypothetical protein DY128_04025 [Apilactobacillus micheneri]TPR50583.1 hypothetical protein DY037_01140 [Apilactobacillus micheneri]